MTAVERANQTLGKTDSAYRSLKSTGGEVRGKVSCNASTPECTLGAGANPYEPATLHSLLWLSVHVFGVCRLNGSSRSHGTTWQRSMVICESRTSFSMSCSMEASEIGLLGGAQRLRGCGELPPLLNDGIQLCRRSRTVDSLIRFLWI